MSFELVELNREHIPGIDAHLISQLEKCLQKAKKRNNRDDADGINQAIQCLKQSTIVCLHVSDSGTTGMSAEIDDPQNYDESPFGKYMVCEDSDQDDRGGSHGQGKYAPIISSVARLIFASSIDGDGQFVVGGRCMYSSVKEEGKVRLGDGYWGSGVNTLPSRELSEMHQWLHRSERGTSIWVIGLNQIFTKDFNLRAATIAASSYFAAIQQNRLVVKFKDLVGEEFNLDSSTLPRIFGESKIDNLLNQNRSEDFEPNRDEFSNVSYYYKAYVGTQ